MLERSECCLEKFKFDSSFIDGFDWARLIDLALLSLLGSAIYTGCEVSTIPS